MMIAMMAYRMIIISCPSQGHPVNDTSIGTSIRIHATRAQMTIKSTIKASKNGNEMHDMTEPFLVIPSLGHEPQDTDDDA
jgi:hypothetical protein